MCGQLYVLMYIRRWGKWENHGLYSATPALLSTDGFPKFTNYGDICESTIALL